MLVINFAHPLTPAQIQQIEEISGQSIERIIDVPSQIDPQQPLAPQVVAMADAAGLTPEQWQTEQILINPPALNFSAVALLAELHGRMGYFPPAIRTRPVVDVQGNRVIPPQFEIAEILNLQEVRDKARARRG
ncbi:MAG: CRISPR-associated protein Csx15 [Anaerolineae bacterium]